MVAEPLLDDGVPGLVRITAAALLLERLFTVPLSKLMIRERYPGGVADCVEGAGFRDRPQDDKEDVT